MEDQSTIIVIAGEEAVPLPAAGAATNGHDLGTSSQKSRSPEEHALEHPHVILDLRLQRLESATRRIEVKVNSIIEATTTKNNATAAVATNAAPAPKKKEQSLRGSFFTLHFAWWLLIFPINFGLLALVFGKNRSRVERDDLATTFALANLLPAILIRDGTFLLLLYKVVVRIPWQKYFVNRMLHCNGGIHTGCSLMLTMWAIISLVQIDKEDPVGIALLSLLCFGLLVMMLLAIRPVRERYHNVFERVHRYLGWSLMLVLTAILVKKFVAKAKWGSGLVIADSVMMLVSIFLVFYSWFIIERQNVQVSVGQQKNIVVVQLHGKARAGAFAKISFDLIEWHAFSVAFSDRENESYGLIVGVAGDWTKKLAQKCSALERMLSRASSLRRSLSRSVSRAGSLRMKDSFRFANLQGVISEETSTDHRQVSISQRHAGETAAQMEAQLRSGSKKTVRAFIRWHRPLGFMYSVYAYKRVICVGTGAGIAPILPHIGNDKVSIHVVWIAKNHREIYGDDICDKVFNHPHHTIYDTSKQGRPNPEIAVLSFKDFFAEAIFIVSNAPFTEAVRAVCKKQRIPAFGAVFDS